MAIGMRAMTAETARVYRGVGWTAFAFLAGTPLLVRLTPLAPRFQLLVSDSLTYLLPIALMIVGGSVAALRYLGVRSIEHRFWGLLVLASIPLLITETHWTWYTAFVDSKGPTPLHPLHLLHFVAALFVLAVIQVMTTVGDQPLVVRSRVYVDLLIVAVASYPIVYWFWTFPMFKGTGLRVAFASVSAAYPVAGGVIFLTALAVSLGWKRESWRSWEVLATASLMMYGLGLVASPLWFVPVTSGTAAQQEVGWYSVVLGSGYYALFMASVYRLTSTEREAIVEPWHFPDPSSGRASLVWSLFLAVAIPALAWWAFATGTSPAGLPVVIAVMVLFGLLAVRVWLSGMERALNIRRSTSDPVAGPEGIEHLMPRLAEEIEEAEERRSSLSIALFDIDDFSRINTVHGYLAGDGVLARVADRLRSQPGSSGAVYRTGSDEFVVVLAGLSADAALSVVRLAWLDVRRHVNEVGPVSLSAGIATYPDHAADSRSLFAAASAARHIARAAEEEPIVIYSVEAAASLDPAERVAAARRRSHRETVHALAAAVDARDPETKDHSQKVADLVSAFAEFLHLSGPQIHLLNTAALLHDIGKIGIRDDVLGKTEPLTPQEWEHIREHPLLGEKILAPARLDELLPLVRSHHERWDGAGYPDGLRADEIPHGARVLALCDAFEAMTSGRAYRPPLSASNALEEIRANAGTQFDPELAERFGRMISALLGESEVA